MSNFLQMLFSQVCNNKRNLKVVTSIIKALSRPEVVLVIEKECGSSYDHRISNIMGGLQGFPGSLNFSRLKSSKIF